MNIITPDKFGRDHFNALLYAETRAVDHSGRLDTKHLRRWGVRGEFHTILQGGEKAEVGHDDISCLKDLESAGVLKFESVLAQDYAYVVTLTDLGWYIAGKLRRNRAEGIADAKAKWEDLIDGYKS